MKLIILITYVFNYLFILFVRYNVQLHILWVTVVVYIGNNIFYSTHNVEIFMFIVNEIRIININILIS